MEIIAFYLFAFLTIAMFSTTVLTNNALYALSSLAAGMIFISAFYFILDAEFLGVVQIVVYTGAVMALYAFGMMFFDTVADVKEDIKHPKLVFLLSGGIALLVVMIFTAPIISGNIISAHPMTPEYGSNVKDVGMVLFTKYLVPFELAAVMLLVAMIGGIILAGRKMDVSITQMTEEEIDKLSSHSDIAKDRK
ncbi:MAG: NADH-quinone oxidoreductase subunit J [Candidatus Izemoplasmatales bacterium]|jgi:NADH-quinone oxidoreductase subunit J|nr:NADH-quinone oxidoreductase subunit J [Candidatus Izemoplasmatales bacterium]